MSEYRTSKTTFPVSILSDRVISKLPRSVETLYEEGDETFVFRAHAFDYDRAMKIFKAAV